MKSLRPALAKASTAATAACNVLPAPGRPGSALLTLAAVAVFALLVHEAGVALATWTLALAAAYAADPRWPRALALATGLTLLCLLLFVYGLQVPLRLWPAQWPH